MKKKLKRAQITGAASYGALTVGAAAFLPVSYTHLDVYKRQDAYRVVEINIATHEVGKTLYEEENPRYRITGIAYDQSLDKLIVVTGKGIYRIADQKMIDLYAYLPEMNERIIREDFNCFLNGKYVFINQSVFFTSDLNGESALKSLRFANNGVSNQSVRDFMRQNPDVKVSFSPCLLYTSRCV